MSRKGGYFSNRTGKIGSVPKNDLDTLKRLFLHEFQRHWTDGYFAYFLGYSCVDGPMGHIAGKLGPDVGAAMYRSIKKLNLWPIEDRVTDYTEDDLFDVMEFLFDFAKKPAGEGTYHSWSNCGVHFYSFEHETTEGKSDWRDTVNALLADYETPFQMNESGEIQGKTDTGLGKLLSAPMPKADRDKVISRLEDAKSKFLRHHASLSDRRDAVRELCDVLEYVRDDAKKVLNNKDEGDLFAIANKFGLRHHNHEQQSEYDKDIFYSWLFYYYLASIHACLRLIERSKSKKLQP